MAAAGSWIVELWNNIVALAPVIIHAVCQVVDQASKVVTF